MPVVSQTVIADIQQDHPLNKSIKIVADPNHDMIPTLGTAQKKKPLPEIPLMKTSLTNLIIQEGEVMTIASHNGFVSVGPSWTTSSTTTSYAGPFITNNEINPTSELYFTESPTTSGVPQQPINKRYSHNLLLTQAHNEYHSNIHADPYYTRQHPIYSQQQSNHQQDPSVTATMNREWKMASKNIHRSDSLKIETTVPVPFSKAGHLPLETHFEKPYEPTLEDLVHRKASKEELFSNSDDVPKSVLLQKLDESGQFYQSSSSSSSSNISTPQDSMESFTSPSHLLSSQQHRHSMPVLHTQEDTSFSAAERYFQPNDISPVSSSSQIPSPWGTSRSATIKPVHRISTGSIPNLMSVQIDQVPDEIASTTTKAERYFNEEDKRGKHSLSIASCSLINIRSNTKLYRRMAIKTRNKETQMTYAKYLLQISKLYAKDYTTTLPVPSSSSPSSSSASLPSLKKTTVETPAETRHRLLSEAGYWIERLAKAGHPEALFIKGRWHVLGPLAEDCTIQGYEKAQETKAFKCFLAASKAGWVDAHYELAHLWKRRGNNTKAIQCYERGARENHTLSVYKMAKILLRGQLQRKRDIPKGLLYLKQAADMHDRDSAEPAFVLGCIHANEFDRIGIQKNVSVAIDESPVNYSLALKYLKKSAKHGYPDAIYFMGQVSETGMLGQLCDTWQAYQNYMKAAEVKHAGAMLDLSRLYSQGISGLLAAQNDMAFKWCKRSADLGFDQAEYVLGKYYEDGIGVTPDFPLALEYFGKAASKGYQPAAEKLNRPLADGTRRRLKKNPTETKEKYLTAVVSDPIVKRDDDDDDTNLNTKINTRGQNNICTIQ